MIRRAIIAALAATLATASLASAGPALAPPLFEQLATGVAKITTFGCRGKPIASGTGFLVGTQVVMTARHVLEDSCKVRVFVNGERIPGERWVHWYTPNREARDDEDVATIRLTRPSNGHIFSFRKSVPPAGANLAMVGYPLGNRLSLTQGPIILITKAEGLPVVFVRMLGAEGASGSPLLDDAGRVVAILQIGLGAPDILGQNTAGVIAGEDFSRSWRSITVDLCRGYPRGGIAGCSTAVPPSGFGGRPVPRARAIPGN